MAFDWRRAVSGAAGGAAGGAAVGNVPGAIVGGGLGLLSGIFGDSGDTEELYRKMLEDYVKVQSDPAYAAQQAELDKIAKSGMSDADRAAVLRQYADAANFAHGREGAIRQRGEMMGGNVRMGQNETGQAQAAQEGANRAFMG